MPIKFHSATLLLVIDLIGTFVFAVEGAMAATQASLDILGLLCWHLPQPSGAE
jgi:uncharacterized membrane protein YeiH